MTKDELKEKIKVVVRGVYNKPKSVTEPLSTDHYLMQKFPALRDAIVNLLTDQYDSFLEDIEFLNCSHSSSRLIYNL